MMLVVNVLFAVAVGVTTLARWQLLCREKEAES